MITAHVKLIQEGEAALFYKFNKEMNGYMICGLFIAPNLEAKIKFVEVWTYFVSEIVRGDDIYCSVPLGIENTMFKNYLTYIKDINGYKIYKVDNFLKKQYSKYEKHLQRKGART